MNLLNVIISALALLLLVYIVRSSRELGTKLSKHQSANAKGFKEIQVAFDALELNAKKRKPLLYLPYLQGQGVDWKFDLCVTSHPQRFEALGKALALLKNQILQPQNIFVFIADGDVALLPNSIKELEKSNYIKVIACDDLGSGKKLIPALEKQGKLPLITIDDDLIFDNDLFLYLMIEHYLFPHSIIAARVHRVVEDDAQQVQSFSQWHKHFDLSEGPSSDFMPTSGAGTLFPANSLHNDVSSVELYSKLSHNTDDLWWYFQARRQGTLVRRLAGFDQLNFIDSTQEVGLWKNGNQERNEVNLNLLLSEYGNPIHL